MITVDDRNFLNAFEDCSMQSACWTHAAHVRMGWLVLETSDSFEHALERMRVGIMRFNSSKNSIGYHETITVAFATLINSRRLPGEDFQSFAKRNGDLFEKGCLSRFYTLKTLRSAAARDEFVPPDLCDLPVSHESVSSPQG